MILAIIVFVFILGILIFVHEFGHFIFAKKLGVKVEEFGIGFPPAIWKKKKGETIYSINAIPLGGFTKLYGEEGGIKEKGSFTSQSLSKRALIVLGGVIMNFLLAVGIFYFLLASNGFQAQFPLLFDYKFPFGTQENFPPTISGIMQNSPAQQAGLEIGDKVIKGDSGVNFTNSGQLTDFINQNKGKEVTLTVEKASKNNQIENINVIPRVSPPSGQGPLGVALSDITQIKYSSSLDKITSGFLHAFNLTHYSFVGLGYYIEKSVSEKNIKPLASSVTGPVGILALTQLTLREGIQQVILLIAVISLALATFNIFPIPALDGGKILFLAIEVIRKKPVKPELEQKITTIFFILLICVLILVSIKDVLNFF